MKKLLSISIVMLAVCTQGVAQEPPDLLAIRAAFAKAIDDHDIDAIISHFTDDGVNDATVFLTPLASPEQMRAMWEDQFSGSSDWHTTDGSVFTVGNIVVVEHAAVGTNDGESSTGPATGLPWTWPHLDVYDFEGDKIKRLMSYGDYASILVQLGMIPDPGMPELVPSIMVPDPEPTGLTPLEANAEHVNRWNSHDAAAMAKIYDTDSKIFAGPLGMALDRVAMTAMNEMYFSAFPDVKLEVVQAIDLGQNWVVTELVARATHQGPFMGIPPMGYPTEIRAVWLIRYSAEGLVAEGSFYYNNLTLMTQMMEEPQYSPAGTWVVKVPTPAGNVVLLHTVSPQEKIGAPFAGIMVQVNANPTVFGMFPEADSSTDWITQTVWKGRNTVETSMLVYGTKKGEGPLAETVFIGVAHSQWTLTGPNTNEGTAVEALYLAEQDADEDGFPDPGEEPVDCLQFVFTSKRLQMMPPCIPTPTPGQ